MTARLSALARLGVWVAALTLAGAVTLQFSLPADTPPATSAMSSTHTWWYLGRASGFVAFGLLLASVLLGLGISSRVFDGVLLRPWVFDMHQFVSIFVLVAMLFHALILLPDPYAHFRFAELMVPFASPYRPVAVGLGSIAFYGSVAVTLSYYARQRIGQRGWRLLHYASFALFAGALAHGALAGADSHRVWSQVVYLAGGLLVVFFTFFRILAARNHSRPKAAASAPASATPAGRASA